MNPSWVRTRDVLNNSAGKASWRPHILTVLDSWYSLDTVSLGPCGRNSLMLKSSVWWGQTWEEFSANYELWTASAERCPWEETTVHPLSAQLWARHGPRSGAAGAGKVRKPVTLGCWSELPVHQQIVSNAESLLELGNMSSHWLQHMQGMGWHFSWCWDLLPQAQFLCFPGLSGGKTTRLGSSPAL